MQLRKASKAVIAGLCALFLLCFLPATILADDDEWLGTDKFMHFGASALIDTACYWTLREGVHFEKTDSLVIAALATLSLGVAKEISDEKFSGKDLAWDIIGTGVGTILWVIIDRKDDQVTLALSSSFSGVQYLHKF